MKRRAKRPAKAAKKGARGSECVIPEPVPAEALEKLNLKQTAFDGAQEIRDYVEWQSPEERVSYVEKISSERIFSTEYETWDVHTTGERYWVITNPTNLYSQRLFPSADYTLSFHVGLMARVNARREARANEPERDRLSVAWRRWSQAGESLDRAHEAEDFQAVGMRCRECLITLVREIADESMIPENGEVPKIGDFIHWTELVANTVASGARAAAIRGYLKTTAKETWQLVNWLTHAANAGRFDAELALEATHATMVAFGAVVLRHERGTPDRCPECSSYQLTTRFLPDLDPSGYGDVCSACGWIASPSNAPLGE